MIKLCVFDLDGTVMDTLASIAYYVNYTLKKLGLEEIEQEKFKYFAGDGRATLLHRSLDFRNADTEENFRTACKFYDEAYEGNFMYLTKPFDGIKEELDRIKQSGRKIAVLSNKPHNVCGFIINSIFGDNYFDYVQGQQDFMPIKPEPSGFLRIVSELECSPEESVMIGDTDVDMKTGVNAGAHSLGVLWGFREREELVTNGAEELVSHPSDILKAIENMNK